MLASRRGLDRLLLNVSVLACCWILRSACHAQQGPSQATFASDFWLESLGGMLAASLPLLLKRSSGFRGAPTEAPRPSCHIPSA